MARETRSWSAIESTNLAGSDRKLTVEGEVQTFKSNETPALAEAKPQGINAKVLILDLSVATSGVGNDVVAWKKVKYVKSISPHQYSDVTIRHDGTTTTVKVKEVRS